MNKNILIIFVLIAIIISLLCLVFVRQFLIQPSTNNQSSRELSDFLKYFLSGNQSVYQEQETEKRIQELPEDLRSLVIGTMEEIEARRKRYTVISITLILLYTVFEILIEKKRNIRIEEETREMNEKEKKAYIEKVRRINRIRILKTCLIISLLVLLYYIFIGV